MKLKGKSAVITGASRGLGYVIARHFAEQGARVCICARDSEELARAAASVGEVTEEKILSLAADISSADDVRALSRLVEEHFHRLDVLVGNAGVHGPKGPIEEVEWEAWAQAININLLGTVLCCRAFLPLLRRAPRGKVLLLSGGGATKPMPFLSAYAASKAAVVRIGETLAEELRGSGIDVNCIAPGALNTRLLDDIIAAGPEKVGQDMYEASLRQKESGGASLEKAAELCAYLASPAADGLTGKLISAVWDPWPQFDEHRSQLDGSDIYTLRRIVPRDRGLGWG
jgi:NAD(P)-dependent dehydrogenase (short-subunit alcohol dehydrogenase family)